MDVPALTPVTFMTSATASTASAWLPLDYRYGQPQGRSVFVQRETSASDEVVLELRITSGTLNVVATATAWTGVGNFNSALIDAPATAVRVRKVGSSAAATVVGLV